MKIEIENNKIVYCVTMLVQIPGKRNFHIFQTIQKRSGNPQDAKLNARQEAKEKYGDEYICEAETVLNLSPKIFLDEPINNLKKI